jgi:hypothetical protein
VTPTASPQDRIAKFLLTSAKRVFTHRKLKLDPEARHALENISAFAARNILNAVGKTESMSERALVTTGQAVIETFASLVANTHQRYRPRGPITFFEIDRAKRLLCPIWPIC